MSRFIPVALVNGLVFGTSFAVGNELFRVYRGGIKKCDKCQAPVGKDGIWRGEREPRSLSIAWTVAPKEWSTKSRMERRKKCFGCQKSLDQASVIVLDRAWHRKCLKCRLCSKQMTGNRYYMLNNQVYDSACYDKLKKSSYVQKTPHTTVIDYQVPAPIESTDQNHNHHQSHPTRSVEPESVRSQSSGQNHEEPGKMSQDMKRRLANDLLNTIMAIRVRETKPKQEERQPPRDPNFADDNSAEK